MISPALSTIFSLRLLCKKTNLTTDDMDSQTQMALLNFLIPLCKALMGG
jgi:hypothetical protein